MPEKKLFFKDLILKILSFGAICLVAFFLIISNLKIKEKREILEEKTSALEEEVKELQEESQELETMIFQEKTESFLEEIAREDLNLKKEGEKVAAFPFQENNLGESSPEQDWWWDLLEKFGLQ